MPANVQHRFLHVGGKKTQLMTLGEGPPLVYLHSAGGETEAIPFHHKLAEKYTVYVPAHPGFALSEGLNEILDIHDLAWHYVDLFAALELEDVPVIGYSLGAWLALELAILRPQLISRLGIIAAAGLYVEGSPMGELFIDDFNKLRELIFFNPESPAALETTPRNPDDSQMLMWLRAREATARVGWNPYLHDPKLPQHLHRVTQPTTIVWGRHDKMIPLAHGEYYAAHLPNATLQILEECGHGVPWEKCDETATLLM
ncbi:alpha/beta hydrolase [Blastopirellula sp. JC732]|uniref:Alpha/beta hydrolase n=1 Tax=Blastopirellula sediminis TaxID=2894196 RepID=A0A9X1MLN3_9BACT|nr:alpha/beta hydrolase [Blastopirellula sediminis]MCC9607586.1 alpha/beta hydrolase [Blastopirellula sediminis]MCC9629121.1 alpha/beta hydrolase [Blastopirellula sediminis]